MKKNIEKKGSILSSEKQYGVQDLRAKLFDKAKGSTLDKINAFTKFMGRQNVAKLIAQNELLFKTKNVLLENDDRLRSSHLDLSPIAI